LSGQIHSPPTLPPAKEPLLPIGYEASYLKVVFNYSRCTLNVIPQSFIEWGFFT